MVNSNEKYPSPVVVAFVRYFILLFSKIFWRISYHGKENIPQDLKGGLLITPNHQTFFDPFWVCLPVKRKLRFMAWDKAFEWFLIGRFIRYLGAFPVNLDRGSKDSYRQALRSLREGATLTIFPEGSRAFSDGELLPFKTGAVRIAMEAGVPILPVTVRGANKVWARDMKYPHFGKVEIIYHSLLKIPKPDKNMDLHEHLQNFTEELKKIIRSA